MSRLIDADAFLQSIPDFDLPTDTIDACTLRILLQNAPAVDAVPVVRCKDCKHWRASSSSCPMVHYEDGWDTEYYTVDNTDKNGTGYCNFGARDEVSE